MPLDIGSQLGPYEILAQIGAGGMGEVYRARDLKLGRDVAMKVLPAGLANDSDYLARFQREAQTLAALNHPNIAAIYGLEANAIVMELVEGETLRAPLPLAEALSVARQIAEALEAAHDKGIIHRDLKPGNVKVTPDGVVKVLDFGLAKAVERATTSSADSPTITMRATEAGLILGTASYMSPEQAAGKAVDRRADIWSFGVVLWELLTGKRLFEGETVSHTLAHVLTGEIDLSAVPEGPVRDLIARCLDRNLKTRLRDIGEARIAIERYVPGTPKAAGTPGGASWWPWAVAGVSLLVAAGLGIGLFGKKSQIAEPVILEFNPPEGARFGTTNSSDFALSPDGRMIAFSAANAKGERTLWLRSMDSLTARAVPESTGGFSPFWSPDSKTVAFGTPGKLKRVDAAGGVPVVVCDAQSVRGGSWGEGGVILFADQQRGLRRVPATGGSPTSVTELDREKGETAHYFPQFLPGGKEFLYFSRNRDAEKSGTFLRSLDGTGQTLVLQSIYQGIYDASSGHILFRQGNRTLVARKMELNPARLSGNAVAVAESVDVALRTRRLKVSVAANGTLIYEREGLPEKYRLAWRDRKGTQLESIGPLLEDASGMRLSPDSTRVLYDTGDSTTSAIWVVDLLRGVNLQVTFSRDARDAIWAADGKRFYYYRNSIGIHRRAADGSGEEESLIPNAGAFPESESADGKYLLYSQSGLEGGSLVHSLSGTGKSQLYLPGRFAQRGATFSPDGRWIAYPSTESGRTEIYVEGFPERRGKWQLSSGGGSQPMWRSDGKELFWVGQGGTLMAASIELQGDGIRPGRAETLFPLGQREFSPARDGKRILVMEREGPPRVEQPLVVMLNWAATLGRPGGS